MSSRRSLQRGKFDRHDRQAVIEVFAKSAVLDRFLQIDIRRGDDPDIHLCDRGIAERGKFALLDHAKQPDLCFRAKIADLVEKDRTRIRNFEQAFFCGDGAGKCALRMPEELRFQQLRRDVRAVNHHERVVRPRARLVDGLGDKFFSGTAFARDQNRRPRRRDPFDKAKDVFHLVRPAD